MWCLFQGHTWTATVKLSNISSHTDSLTGTQSVTFDRSTGKATFDLLRLTHFGTHFLTVHITSAPVEYDIYDEVMIQVLNQKQLDLMKNNSTNTTRITMKFDADYDTVVGSDGSEKFGAMVINVFAMDNPNVLFYNVTVTKGLTFLKNYGICYCT